jgi:hypothetical protein
MRAAMTRFVRMAKSPLRVMKNLCDIQHDGAGTLFAS